ncbi:MAG TPA: hypothetical protein VIL30_01810 [Ramlibacter sp.]|jgi:hypothetical protein
MTEPAAKPEKSPFLAGLRNGVILGVVVLAVLIPWLRSRQAPAPAAPTVTSQAPAVAPAAPAAPAAPRFPGRLPDFGTEIPSADVRHVANWAFFTGDHQGKAVVVLDKKAARVWAFDPQGKLTATTPALLGSAVGDDSAPGIGDKPLSAIRPEEKTTPAGRFVAEPGMNTSGEDIVWVDYDAAVSMHRVRPTVAAERRLERLASPTEADNRISFGCVNLPVAFYENVLSPTVKAAGAIVYVLPETREPQQVFGSWDVTDPAQMQGRQVAAAQPRAPARPAAPAKEARTERDALPQQ